MIDIPIIPQTDIALLMSTDPLKLTEIDIEAMVAKMRQQRGQYNLGNMKAGSSKPPTAKASAASDLAKKLGLELDL